MPLTTAPGSSGGRTPRTVRTRLAAALSITRQIRPRRSDIIYLRVWFLLRLRTVGPTALKFCATAYINEIRASLSPRALPGTREHATPIVRALIEARSAASGQHLTPKEIDDIAGWVLDPSGRCAGPIDALGRIASIGRLTRQGWSVDDLAAPFQASRPAAPTTDTAQVLTMAAVDLDFVLRLATAISEIPGAFEHRLRWMRTLTHTPAGWSRLVLHRARFVSQTDPSTAPRPGDLRFREPQHSLRTWIAAVPDPRLAPAAAASGLSVADTIDLFAEGGIDSAALLLLGDLAD